MLITLAHGVCAANFAGNMRLHVACGFTRLCRGLK